ncbi:hypothetical protein XH79_31205 [Bradyrhizobium sp. CCBAU 45389]|nr:hypothetical protein [Bradyrhizobium sp. CCBAU 45389]
MGRGERQMTTSVGGDGSSGLAEVFGPAPVFLESSLIFERAVTSLVKRDGVLLSLAHAAAFQ